MVASVERCRQIAEVFEFSRKDIFFVRSADGGVMVSDERAPIGREAGATEKGNPLDVWKNHVDQTGVECKLIGQKDGF